MSTGKKQAKCVLSLVIALVMLFSALPAVNVFAAGPLEDTPVVDLTDSSSVAPSSEPEPEASLPAEPEEEAAPPTEQPPSSEEASPSQEAPPPASVPGETEAPAKPASGLLPPDPISGVAEETGAHAAEEPVEGTEIEIAEDGAAVELGILTTTDMHGRIYDRDPLSGGTVHNSFLKASTVINAQRDALDATIVIDNGDIIQGTAMTSYNVNVKGGENNPMAVALRHIGYDAFVPGNHEYNFVPSVQQNFYDMLLEAEGGARPNKPVTPIAANILETATNEVADPFVPYITKEVTVGAKTFKIGIIGFENVNVPNWDPESHYPGLKFYSTGNTEQSYVEEWNTRWKDKLLGDGEGQENCDIVVASLHAGAGNATSLVKENQARYFLTHTDGVDLVICGHDHTALVETLKNAQGEDVPLVNGGGSNVTKTVFTLREDGTVALAANENIPLNASVANDEALKAKMQPYYEAADEFVNQPIGKLTGEWDEVDNYFRQQGDGYDLVSRAMMWAPGATEGGTAADIAIVGPVNRTGSNPGRLFAEGANSADISLKDLYNLYRYDNNLLYQIDITGAQLKRWMEGTYAKYATGDNQVSYTQSFGIDIFYGVDYDVYVGEPAGSRVRNVTYKGQPLADDQVLSAVISSYRLSATGENDEFGWFKATGITADSPQVKWIAAETPEFGAVGGSIPLIIGEYVKAMTDEHGSVTPERASEYTIHNTTAPADPEPEKDIVAEWTFSGALAAATNSVPATGGANGQSSTLQVYKNAAAYTFPGTSASYSSGGLAGGNGWVDGSGNPWPGESYWLLSTSTAGFKNLEFSFEMRSSNTGPRDFKLQYSTDKTTWANVPLLQYAAGAWTARPDGAMQAVAGGTLPQAGNKSKVMADFSTLQDTVSGKENLHLRLLLVSNVSANGGVLANGGTNTANFFTLSGEYAQVENQVEPVTADKEGAVPLNAVITLRSATPGATLEVSEDGETFTPLADGALTLDSLPYTFQARAVKEGMAPSRVKTFSYTQAQLARVQASPSSGAVLPDTAITLTAEEGAAIQYTLTKNVGDPENEAVVGAADTPYTEPIVLPDGGFPYKLEAKATREGYRDSAAMAFQYSRQKPGGGERNYFGQLHAHTTLSDGAGEVEEAFEYAHRTAGLDFFAVTDHSNSFDTANSGDKAGTYNLYEYNADNPKWVRGHQAAAAETQYAAENTEGDFIGMYGYEMTWSGGPGHINTFNTQGFVSRLNSELNSKPNDAGMKAYYALLKATPESISQFNHPGTTFGNFTNFGYYDPLIDKQVTLVEVGNGEGTIGSGGYFPSYEQYTLALDKGWHVAPTNNQDNHKKGWGTSNTCRTVIWTNDFSEAGLYEAMRQMRVYATEVSDLDITYFVNDAPLGSQLEVPATAHFVAEVKNPTAGNLVKSVSLISTGGVEVHKQTFNTQNASFEWTKEAPNPGYYYLKVVDLVNGQERIAVTAPVWLGKADAVGITEFKKSTDLPVTTEEFTLTTGLFNNEEATATLTAIEYAVEGEAPFFTATPNTPIPANGGSIAHSAPYTPVVSGPVTMTVKATVKLGGVSKEYTSSLSFKVTDIDSVVYVGIDGSHRNEYVSGNYKDSMGNFTTLAAEYGVRTVTLNTSEELIAAAANPKYVAMFLTAPSRRLQPYTDSAVYSDAELAALKAFAQAGKTVVVAGWSDVYENYDGFKALGISHMAEEQNRLLAALGSSLRLADDAAGDNVLNPSDQFRLYLTGDEVYNYDNPFMDGVVPQQEYSNYGGSTVYAANPATGAPLAELPAGVSPLIFGLPTTRSVDRDGDGFGPPDGATVPRYGDSADAGQGAGQVLLNASETLNHGGTTSTVIVAGAAFMSNFEIKIEMDNPGTLPYSNYTILSNLVEALSPQSEAMAIRDAKALAIGTEVTIEGIATSGVNTQSVNPDTNKGFFDCIYVQDATGGLNLFPVAEGVQEGQRIRVYGTISEYQGEKQLAVTRLRMVDAAITPLEPTVLSTAATMSATNTGLLVRTTGTVSDIVKDGDRIAQFQVNDGSGAALVYINGYITPAADLSFVTDGAEVTVAGLASIGENYANSNMLPRIRVRDRGEIAPVSGEKTEIMVLSTTDMHGKVWDKNILNDANVNNSYLKASTAVKDIRAEYGAENVILMDNGDAFQGTPISSYNVLSKGGVNNPVAIALRYMEYDSFTLGNHEFNYPWDTMKGIYDFMESPADANGKPVPVLAANIYDKQGNNVFTPYVIREFEVDGLKFKVGILGFENTDCERWDVPANYPGMTFWHPGNPNASMAWEAQRYLDILKDPTNEDYCDIVVVAYHSGMGNTTGELVPHVNSENQIARMVAGTEGIDMVVAGHDHSRYSNRTTANKNGVDIPVVNGGTQDLTRVKITARKVDGKLRYTVSNQGNLRLSSEVSANDPALKALIQPAVDDATAYVSTVVGKLGTDANWSGAGLELGQTDAMDLINRSQMWVLEQNGQPVDVSTTTNITSGLSLAAGDVSIKDLFSLYRYDNYLYVVEMNGAELRAWVEAVGRYYKTTDEGATFSKNSGSPWPDGTSASGSNVTALFYGLDFTQDLAVEPDGGRVTNLRYSKTGRFVEDGDIVRVAVNNYLIGQAPFTTRTGKTVNDALWSSERELGIEDGQVLNMVAAFVGAETAAKGSVNAAPSGWGLGYNVAKLPNKNALEALYNENKDRKSSDYISGWEAFAKALNTARQVLDNSAATTPQIEDAFQKLQTAVANLRVKPGTVPVSGVSISRKNLELTVGKTATLTATVAPSNATNKNITWTSSDSSVALVSNGVVRAGRSGKATITAITADGGHKATCAVTVIAVPTGVTLNAISLTLDAGKAATLRATVAPADAANKQVTWRSSNPAVATVNANGRVNALKRGKATIIVRTVEGGLEAACTVTVNQPVTGIRLNMNRKVLAPGKSVTLKATISPGDANNKQLRWKSSNTKVATVNSKGKVTAKKPGSATITATTSNNKRAKVIITVHKNAQSVKRVTLNIRSVTLVKGKSLKLKAAVMPKNATDKKLIWSSSNKKVATVNGAGKVVAKGKGTAVITVTTRDGGKIARCRVRVK